MAFQMSGDAPIGLTPDPNRPGASAGAPKPTPPRAAPKPPPSPVASALGGLAGLRVSLMPTEGEAGKPDLRRRTLILILVLIIESLMIGGASFYFERDIVSRRAAKAVLETEVQGLESQVKAAAQQVTDMDRLDRQAGAELESLDQHAFWTNLFVFIERNTRPNITVDNFSGALETGTVTLNLVGKTYRDIAEQIILLRQQSAVKQVRVTSAAAKVGADGAIEGVFAVLTMKLDPALWLESAAPLAPANPPAAPVNQP